MRLPTTWPGLSYEDAPAAIRFLVDTFGFVEHLVVPGDGDGVVQHAELLWSDGGGVMLGTSRPDNAATPSPGCASVYVVTDSPDELYERATAAGATVVSELHDEDFGSRTFTVRDPEGNTWTFGTYRGA